MKLFSIPNLSATSAVEQLPWEFKPKIPKKVSASSDKPAFIEWCTLPGTKHCFFSPFEGTVPGLRVNAVTNTPIYLHGFVADYDTRITDDLWDSLPGRSKTEILPAWGSSTWSGGARLVWEFEEPLLLTSWSIIKIFMKLAAKKMGMQKLFPGFDTAFYTKPDQYYEVGSDWRHLSSDKVPKVILWAWLAEAGDACTEKTSFRVPLEEVAKEVEVRFPSRWQGPFELGARGIRFWDPDADNHTAAIIRENGMQCFTGSRGFVSWIEIFGRRWADRFMEEQAGSIVADWWYDGQYYWTKNKDFEAWQKYSKDDFKLLCKVQYGLSSTAGKKTVSSEFEMAAFQVQRQKRVDAVMPRVHFPDGLVLEGGQRILNTSTIRCLQPVEEPREWGEGFPWLGKFFDSFFVSDEQKEVFLAWLKWFYVNGLNRSPKSGQAVFIAGDKGVGKTFLSSGIVSLMVGGHQDARTYLLGESSAFTDYIMESPLLTMDDAEPAGALKTQIKFNNNVKRMVANQYHHFEKKFSSAGQTVWLGRIMISCNLDHESLRILPSLEISNRDKVTLLQASRVRHDFLPLEEQKNLVREELPSFCRWLCDWEIPEVYVGDPRFGVVAFHDPYLRDASAQGETSFAFSELLDEFRVRCWAFNEKTYWEGSATMLLSTLMATPDLEVVSRPFADTRTIGRALGKLASRQHECVELLKDGRQKIWRIHCDPKTWPEHMLAREMARSDPRVGN